MVTDITYLSTLEGWVYLAVVIDLFSRKVVSYKSSTEIEGLTLQICAYQQSGRVLRRVQSDAS